MVQDPRPDSYLLKWQNDVLAVTLDLGRAVEKESRAVLRTNLGAAGIRRREIIDETERGITPLARAWNDIPMRETAPGVFRCEVLLREVGIFSAKACFFPAGSSTPIWPEGNNFHVKVEPAVARCNNSIYTAFVRQFGNATIGSNPINDDIAGAERFLDGKGFTVIPPSGTFRDLIRHLPTIIGEMHFKIVQLLPIFPTPTTFARMGRYGSAFAATDFLSVNPSCAEFDRYATPLDQFCELADAIHAGDGLLFVDLPANHTGWAATLQTHHPEWYHRATDGKFVSPGAWGVTWEDLVELDYASPELRAYMAEVFLFWCRHGVDGFRCDAGYMIPEETWNYICARVREEYPDTVFMLEGLGGDLAVTDRLLGRAGLDWAYSEIFQTYDRNAFKWYLPGAIERAERYGALVHFAETHDNDRLAKGGKTYAKMRVTLAALLSHQGAWGMANGVEWFATEKIDVHGSSTLNWGAGENIVAHIGKLNSLLANHPAFSGESHQEFITEGDGNTLAVKRSYDGGTLLLLCNLDCANGIEIDWDRTKFVFVEGIDLLTERVIDLRRVHLGPGEVMCVDVPDAGGHAREPEKVVFESNAESRYIVRFEYPVDARREVVVPDGGALEVCAHDPFRVELKSGEKTVGFARGEFGGESFKAVIVPPPYSGDGTRCDAYRLKLVVFGGESRLDGRRGAPALPGDITEEDCPMTGRAGAPRLPSRCQIQNVSRSLSTIKVAPPAQMARMRLQVTGEDVRRNPELRFALSNGAGADSFMPVSWGTIRSQYDSMFSANPNPRVPSDRLVLWSRTHAWLQHEGYSREVNNDCLETFTADPAGRFANWHFVMPCGMGRRAAFDFTLSLAKGRNAARLAVRRVDGGERDVEGSVRLVLRPDIEWRSFHSTTKAQGDVERAFAGAVRNVSAMGFTFRPYGDDELAMRIVNGTYHNEPEWKYMIAHPDEAERGQSDSGDLYSPGWISCDFAPKAEMEIVASYEKPGFGAGKCDFNGLPDASESKASLPVAEAIKSSMDLFVQKRDDLKTVIAGYPWFLDWGRDTLIFLRGYIAAGHDKDALAILTAFARFEENGTIPNIIYGEAAGNRDTSDAPLWLIVAASDLVAKKGRKILDTVCGRRRLGAVLKSIVVNYIKGTPNGIRVDGESGLVWSPSHFTWMDTNYPAGTPRIGYPVEIQALWIASLRFLGRTVDAKYSELADKATESLLKYFHVPGKGLADCLRAPGGEPAARAEREDVVRPNQLFVLALCSGKDFRLPDEIRREMVMACSALVVPGGVRSAADGYVECDMSIRDNGRELVSAHNPYHGRYVGDEDTQRKPAYHNGTVWAWPFPMYAEALVKSGLADRKTALSILSSAVDNVNDGCLCHISEIADGDAPHGQKGCRAQAWSASEFYRVWKWLEK